MQIVGDRLRLDAEKLLEMRRRVLEGPQGLEVLHIPDMLADKGVLTPGDAERIFQLTADGQNRERFARQLEREGCVAAGAAQRIGLSVECPYDRVVTPGPDLTVVHEKCIRQPRQ